LNASVAYGRLPAEPEPSDGAQSPLDTP
jgi:hypothetical protein